MSARRVWSSQSETVRRKLSIMIPIPTVVDTATTRAAVATPVRLIDAGMLRAAIFPGVPKTRARTGWIPRTRRVTAPGVRSAYPATRQNRPQKDRRMLREGYSCIPAPSRIRPAPAAETTGRIGADPRLDGGTAHRRPGAGWWSPRGRATATPRPTPKVPSAAALRNVAAVGATSRMDTTKYRSPMERVTIPRRNFPRKYPKGRPRTVPATPRTAASERTCANTSLRVTPSARSVPTSCRRCRTEKVIVL